MKSPVRTEGTQYHESRIRGLRVPCVLVAGIAWVLVSCGQMETDASMAAARPTRILSLAPSITEILFAVGAGERVVGVTKFCNYPPEAATLPRVGGYLDPNYEAIVRLKPNLILMLPEHEKPEFSFREMGLRTLATNHRSVEGVLASILRIGKAVGCEDSARAIHDRLQKRMAKVASNVAGLPRPRILICIGRNMGSGSLKDLYIAGNDGYFARILDLAGGENAYRGVKIKYPIVSLEGIIKLNPDLIVDVVPDMAQRGWTEEIIRGEWQSAAQVTAVKTGRIVVLGQDYAAVPGPRFVLVLEAIARALHPDAEWEDDPS